MYLDRCKIACRIIGRVLALDVVSVAPTPCADCGLCNAHQGGDDPIDITY